MRTLRNVLGTFALSLLAGFTATAQLYTPSGVIAGSSGHLTNVGISTSSPVRKLDIYKGDLIFTGDPLATNNAFTFHHQYWLTGGALILSPALASNGNMVNTGWEFTYNGEFRSYGKIWAPEVEVKLPPFPDYVFEEDYSLMSIEELDNFISENGHLPGLPSAEDVAQNGIGLGEMQCKLLEKVEELTLYVIALQKQNEALEDSNNELRAFILNQENQ